MNITAFLNYLNKTRGWAINADYYGYIETWRQWWQGSVPKVHTRAAEYANGTKKRPIASCGCRNGSARTGQTCC